MPQDIPRLPTAAEAARLRAFLLRARYADAAVCERLGISSVVAVEPLHVPHYLQRLAEPDPQSALIRLFLLQRPVRTADFLPAVETADQALLVDLGLAERHGDELSPRVALVPYDSQWFITDRDDLAGEGVAAGRFDAVMPLNLSSHTLARLIPSTSVDSALDVGAGCGVHAIRAARHACRVVATDLNPRALEFARFNAALNGASVEFREGDLWQPVGSDRFDLIVANPAFSLSPATELLYRDGGVRGDRMSGALLAGAADHLRVGGVAVIIGEFPTVGEAGFEEQVEGWVGDAPCDLVLLRFGAMEPLEYAVAYAHQVFGQTPATYEAAAGARLQQFAAISARDVVLGAVVLRRRETGPPVAVRRVLPAPERSIGADIARLLRCLAVEDEECAARHLWEGTPRMTTGLQMTETRVWSPDGWQEDAARVSLPEDPFCHDLQLSGPARDLLVWCDGTRPGKQIAVLFARAYQLAQAEATEATMAFLQELAEQGLIQVEGSETAEGSGEEGRRSGRGSGGGRDE
jgi:hypothetical protein